ncbi:MAG: ATP-dependent sacrificial sulfur transferase LarE [Alphaproteobacteria bacterium]|nr:ATP-dependent sacrificial sulfur transferase LarE [Alphaproteobacteria bacterium]
MNTADRIKEYLRPLCSAGIALAFSGGTDSTLLLAVLHDLYNERPFPAAAFYAQSVFQKKTDISDVHSLCILYNTELIPFQTDPLSLPAVKNNRSDRCYWCKKDIFSRLINIAREKGLKTVIDGTNADDLNVYRPGLKALKELGVLSPLAELGISKKEIRRTAEELGLKNATKPSAPCLATRFEYDTELSFEKINKAALGEDFLQKILPHAGNIRLRCHDNLARIETTPDSFTAVLQHAEKITEYLKKLGFSYITLDLEGFRSGSMDIFKTKET